MGSADDPCQNGRHPDDLNEPLLETIRVSGQLCPDPLRLDPELEEEEEEELYLRSKNTQACAN